MTVKLPEGGVAEVFGTAPAAARARLLEIRELIFEAAEDANAGTLTETLKWGEPAYLTEATKSGSTIRIAYKPSDLKNCAVYMNCRTDLIDRCREKYPDTFTYVGDRAILVPLAGRFDADALRAIAAMALTYHRDKRRG